MEELTAVRTTGISSRAGCAGRPKIQNIEMFQHPAAAETAGYQACLRCRPDQLPVPEADPSVPHVVSKAPEFINDGFLDNESEAALGHVVGLHHRQLRRLFLEHLGATATKMAISRRAHFERRLLDKTNLAIEDVAYASGFQSVRQCRRVIQETFRFSPSELRKRRSKNALVEPDGGVRLRLPTPTRYSAEQILSFLRQRATPGTEIVDGLLYRRTIMSCGHIGVIEVEANPACNELVVTAHLPTLTELLDIVSRKRRLFGLQSSNQRAVQALTGDPALQTHIASSSVYVPGAWDPFESAIRSIVGQQVSVPGATMVTVQLTSPCGTQAPGLESFGLIRGFPTPMQIVEADLSTLGMSRKRQQTVQTYAEWALKGKIPTVKEVVEVEDLVASLEQIPALVHGQLT